MESMITYIYNEILKKEKLLNFEIFIKKYETFEEIPLVSRYEHLNFLNEKINKDDLQFFLVNIAVYILNNINLYAKNKLAPKEYDDYFICITFSDFDDAANLGYVIPNFFVTRRKELLKFLSIDKDQTLTYHDLIVTSFSRCGLANSFGFIETVSADKLCGDLIRIYAIDHLNLSKMRPYIG